MADELNILTPSPAPNLSQVVRLRTPHQLALVELAHVLGWPAVTHTRQSGFEVRIAQRQDQTPLSEADRERAWVQFAIDGRRKDQWAVLAELAALAWREESEHALPLPPPPYLQLARGDEPLELVPHRFTRADGTLSGRRLTVEDGYALN